MSDRPDYNAVLRRLNLLDELAAYQPMVIGTPPLGIDIDSSDIDVACTSNSLPSFAADAAARFGRQSAFEIADVAKTPDAAMRVSFSAFGWVVELFCQTLPIQEQWGVRHFLIEQRLLAVLPDLKSEVIALKKSGQKTEPAFAAILDLAGDPYAAMLDLESLSDKELASLQS